MVLGFELAPFWLVYQFLKQSEKQRECKCCRAGGWNQTGQLKQQVAACSTHSPAFSSSGMKKNLLSQSFFVENTRGKSQCDHASKQKAVYTVLIQNGIFGFIKWNKFCFHFCNPFFFQENASRFDRLWRELQNADPQPLESACSLNRLLKLLAVLMIGLVTTLWNVCFLMKSNNNNNNICKKNG